jgi:SAM-dependent methyltransferase
MYKYHNSNDSQTKHAFLTHEKAKVMGESILHPALGNPDYLILCNRREIIQEHVRNIPMKPLDILDIGGRIQPYRSLLEGRVNRYVAIDPILEGLTDIVAVGEHVPFRDHQFDIVICMQVLGYAKDPLKFVSEIHRVLKIGGILLFSVPSLSICHHDERWRFLPDGLRLLFSEFYSVVIVSEGTSAIGILRTINTCFFIFPS